MRGDGAIQALKEYTKGALTPDEMKTLPAQLAKESDRAVVIIMAAMVEDEVTRRVMKSLAPLNSAEKSRLFGPRGIGTFSGYIDMAYAMRLLTKDDRDDLNIIREMRNACAHSKREISFETAELANALRFLRPPRLRVDSQQSEGLRMAFMFYCIYFILRGQLGDERGAKLIHEMLNSIQPAERSPFPGKSKGG